MGQEQGPYSLEESQEMLLRALRFTVPKFELNDLGKRRYTTEETQILNQIAGIYSRNGEHTKALQLYGQLYEYVRKNDDQLSTYAPQFTLIAHNYARELGLSKNYHQSIEIALQGRQTAIKYGYYEFSPGFLYIAGECYYRIGETKKSKKLMLRAHYLYEELEDEHNLILIDRDIKSWFGIDFED